MKYASLAYLIIGTLAVIGYVAFFNRWPGPVSVLFFFSIPFYIGALTFVNLVHPACCIAAIVKQSKSKQKIWIPVIHLIWSLTIAFAFVKMVWIDGYIITV